MASMPTTTVRIEPELKEQLLGLLKENPYFKGFD